LNAVIKAALDLLECDNPESAKALLRAFSGDSANTELTFVSRPLGMWAIPLKPDKVNLEN
jgi:hypothetical protein